MSRDDIPPDERAKAWTEAFMASTGQLLTPRLRQHLIEALQREQAAWETATGRRVSMQQRRPGFWARVWAR